MSLSYRKRGDVWHVRGTIRVGRETIAVPEHSTGCGNRADAEAIGAAEESRVRLGAIEGPSKASRRVTIGACILSYGLRPGGVEPYDAKRLEDLAIRIGNYPLPDAENGWQDWLRGRGAKMAPGTAARWRAILQAAINHGAAAHGQEPPRLKAVREKPDERVRFLAQDEAERLLDAYNQWVKPVAVVLAYQGLRSQEALRLDWREVSWPRGTLFISRSKSGKARTVPMHPRVRTALHAIWMEREKPTAGEVFMSQRGKPYSDTGAGRGGNPLSKAHATACEKAGIADFTPHDWRHHWASWMVMSGVDLYTLMRLGGWASLKMVQRYAAVSGEHMAEAIAKLK